MKASHAAAMLALWCCALVGVTDRAGAAADPGPALAPHALADLSSWSFMVGHWSCAYGAPNGSGPPFTQDSELIDNGAWLHTRSMIPLLAGPNRVNGTLVVDAYTTGGAGEGNWFYTEIDSIGGHTSGTSPGWRGNSFAWSLRDPMTGRVLFTTTITKAGDREFATATDVMVAGHERPGLVSTCRKA